jgi:hypothetical protein
MKLSKTITWRGHKWNEVIPEDNQSMKEDGYDIILRRSPCISELRRYGSYVGGIDAKSSEILARYPHRTDILIN